MKKVLKNTKKTRKYLETLPKIYLVGCWARYGVREYYYTNKNDKNGVPLVYDYYDGNGTCDLWELIPITETTCGAKLAYSQTKETAQGIADALNSVERSNTYYKGNIAKISYNADGNTLMGSIYNHADITFKAKTCNGIVNAFHKAVDDAPGKEYESVVGTTIKTIEDKQDE